MNRLSAAPHVPSRYVLAVLAAVLLAGPALADEAKARGHLERARELQKSGGTDVARWLRELRSARQVLERVEEGKRAGLLGEVDAVLAAGMDQHLEKAREQVRSGGLRRADLYYLKPAEQALNTYADDATLKKYGAVIEELRREGQEIERRATAEREREAAKRAADRERAAAERKRAAAERAAERKRAAAERAAERERAAPAKGAGQPEVEAPDGAPVTPERRAGEGPASGSLEGSEALDGEAGARATPDGEAAGARSPQDEELSVGAMVLAVLGFLVVSVLVLAVGGWLALYALVQVRTGNVGSLAFVAFSGFGGLVVVMGVAVAFEDPVGGVVTMAFGSVFVGVGFLARKLFKPPEGKREVVVSSHAAEVRTYEGLPAQRVREVKVLVDEGASEEEVAAAQREWKRSLWRRREDWTRGSIEEDAVRHGGLALCGAALWAFFSLVLAGVWWFSEDEVIGLSAAGTGLVALLFVGAAVRMKLHERKFGASRLVLAGSPLFLGERLQGVIHTGVSRQVDPLRGFRLRLRCVHSYEQSSSSQDRGKVRRRDVLWENEVSVSGGDSTENPGRLDVQVDLELPADKDETSAISRDGILWELELYADLPGLDYSATFELPVFRRDEGAWEAAS